MIGAQGFDLDTVTILISGVVSLTLVPMMSARWLRSHEQEKPSKFAIKFQRNGFDSSHIPFLKIQFSYFKTLFLTLLNIHLRQLK